MKQNAEAFLTCSAKVPYGDVAGDTACMVKNGYDPKVYTVQQATELAGIQARDALAHPGGGMLGLLGVVALVLVAGWALAKVFKRAITQPGGSETPSMVDFSSTWNGKTHWSTRETVDGGFSRVSD